MKTENHIDRMRSRIKEAPPEFRPAMLAAVQHAQSVIEHNAELSVELVGVANRLLNGKPVRNYKRKMVQSDD